MITSCTQYLKRTRLGNATADHGSVVHSIRKQWKKKHLQAQAALSNMSRGNQRDVDRARAAKRAEKTGKKTDKEKDGLTAAQRRERDAKALQEKLAKKGTESK